MNIGVIILNFPAALIRQSDVHYRWGGWRFDSSKASFRNDDVDGNKNHTIQLHNDIQDNIHRRPKVSP